MPRPMISLYLIKYLLGSVSYDSRNVQGRGTGVGSSIGFGEKYLEDAEKKGEASGIKLTSGRALMRSGLVRVEEERERVGFGNMERKTSLLPRGRDQQRGNPGERKEAATSFQFRCFSISRCLRCYWNGAPSPFTTRAVQLPSGLSVVERLHFWELPIRASKACWLVQLAALSLFMISIVIHVLRSSPSTFSIIPRYHTATSTI